MKRVYPSVEFLTTHNYIKFTGNARRFKRYWGTTTVTEDGGGSVEVLKDRQYYYPAGSRSGSFLKLFTSLGMYDDVNNANPQGIDSAWIYLNKNNASALPESPGVDEVDLKDFITYNLNQLWWDNNDGPKPTNLTLTTSIVIEAVITTDDYGVSTSPILINSGNLVNDITTNYENLWNTCHISQQGVGIINKGSITDPVTKVVTPDEDDLTPNDPWLNIIARYALRTGGIPCTVKRVEIGLGRNEINRYYRTYVADIEIPEFTFTNTDTIVQLIANDINTVYKTKLKSKFTYPNGYYTKQIARAMSTVDIESDVALYARPYRLWEDDAYDLNPIHNGLWVASTTSSIFFPVTKYYLRADVLDNPTSYGMTYKELYSYILSTIDSGYQKKKVKWYKKLLAVIVFVVVFAITYDPATSGWAAATSMATAVVVASVAISLLGMLASSMGMEDWALAFAEVSRTMEPLVTIAQIILILDFFSNMWDRAASTAADQASVNMVEATVADTVGVLAENVVDSLINQITSVFSNVTAGTITTSTAIKYVGYIIKAYTLPQQIKLKELQERNKDLQAEYEKMAEEGARETDPIRMYMNSYYRPATADWSLYASTFDRPYERGGGTLAMGNIQRTTKQALRKANYTMPVFDNIIGV